MQLGNQEDPSQSICMAKVFLHQELLLLWRQFFRQWHVFHGSNLIEHNLLLGLHA
jgi:hypothetical protein